MNYIIAGIVFGALLYVLVGIVVYALCVSGAQDDEALLRAYLRLRDGGDDAIS